MNRMLIVVWLLAVGAISKIYASDPKAFSSDAKVTTIAPIMANSPYKVEIKSWRWRKHPKKNYERLVLEFIRKDNGTASSPTPNVIPAANGKETTIAVNSVALTGEVNEAKVSDTYASQSQYLGPLSILADSSGNGFSLKIPLKKSDAVAEAFWLESPARLVVDVFASASDRNSIQASALEVIDTDEKGDKPATKITDIQKSMQNITAEAQAEPVSEKKSAITSTVPSDEVANVTATTSQQPRNLFATTLAAHKPKRSKRNTMPQLTPLIYATQDNQNELLNQKKDPEYLCFPASAQVGLSVFFSPKNKRMAEKIEEVRMDIQNTHQKLPTTSSIVCYPASAQVEANISFLEDRPLMTNHEWTKERLPASK